MAEQNKIDTARDWGTEVYKVEAKVKAMKFHGKGLMSIAGRNFILDSGATCRLIGRIS